MDEKKEGSRGNKSWLRELIESVLPALIIVLVVNVFLAQATRVEGQSMEPTLFDDQRLIIEKLSYRFHTPQRGDIVVLRPPTHASVPLIKRVIGLPGETLEIRDGNVFVNGQVLREDYLREPTHGRMGPTLVPEQHVLVLGDNRDASNDSRSFGMISYSDIIGKAWLRYWPLDQFGVVDDVP